MSANKPTQRLRMQLNAKILRGIYANAYEDDNSATVYTGIFLYFEKKKLAGCLMHTTSTSVC
jgi:hypothetical protein